MSALLVLPLLFIQTLSSCNHASEQLYLCVALESLSTNSLSGSISYQVELGDTIYPYSHITQSASNPINFGSYISCFEIPEDATKSCHNIYQSGSTTNHSLCMYNIAKIAPVGFKKQILQVPYISTIGDYGQFTVYTANTICITIKNANMSISNQYYVTGSMYCIDGNMDSIDFITYLSSISINPEWNQVICLPGKATNDTSQIGIQLSIATITGASTSIQTQIINRNVENTGNGNDESLIISFDASTTLNIEYWESCDGSNRFNRMKTIQNKITAINFNFLLWLIIIATLTIFIVCILSFVIFKHGDPINYYAIVWMVLELWDFESDIGFTVYLWYFYEIYGIDDDQLKWVLILFIAATFFVIIPYLSNLSYLNNLIKMWTQPTSAGSSKEWLESKYGKWILLFICLITGGVHPALEICNSLLFPIHIFSMHLPFNEHVRIRTERFLTNVGLENFPFLLIQICFYIILNKHDNDDLNNLNSSNYVFWGGVTSSLLSVIFSATYYFSFRHQQQIAEANYKFSFEIQSEQLKKTWIHSHWRIQTSISRAFQTPSPTLIIIDSCYNISDKNKKTSKYTSKRMIISGRILKDRSASTQNLDSGGSIRGSTSIERKNCLFKLICNTFDLNENKSNIYSIIIEKISNERVFDLENVNTMKWICCWCCCKANEKKFEIKHRLSSWSVPSYFIRRFSKSPPPINNNHNNW